jgi:hypothetical protein
MPASKDIPWTRLIAEGVAIVLSILLAFSIDAWWADLLERRAQSVELNRLHEEFSEIRRQLDMESRERVIYAAAQLLEMSQGHVTREDSLEVSDALLSDLVFYGNFDVATPILDGIILSGRLDAFESERVVTAIFAWRLAIKEVIENDNRLRELATVQLIPALIERGNMATALLRKTSDPDGTTQISVDSELEGYIALRLRMNRIFDSRLSSLGPILDEVLAAIEHELKV